MSTDDLKRLREQVGEREIGSQQERERYERDRPITESEDLGKRSADNTDRVFQDLQSQLTEWKPKE